MDFKAQALRSMSELLARTSALTPCCRHLQRFLYRSKDIEGLDRAALQRDIMDTISTEGGNQPGTAT